MGTNDPVAKATEDQTRVLRDVVKVLTALNDNFVAVNRKKETEEVTPAIVPWIPVAWNGKTIGSAQVTSDKKVYVEVDGDLGAILINLVSLNQLKGLRLELEYVNPTEGS